MAEIHQDHKDIPIIILKHGLSISSGWKMRKYI